MKRLLALLLLILLPCTALAEKKITVTFTGDVTLGGEYYVQKDPDSFTGYYKQYGPAYFFEKLQGLFAGDDLTVVNLEGVLSDSGTGEDTKKQYRFRAPTSFTDVLTSSSIELCGLSNNHTYDFTQKGMKSTKRALLKAGLEYTVLKRSYTFEKDGIRIGFLSMTQSNFTTDREWVTKEIRRLKAEEGVAAVVVSIHAGQEYATRHRSQETRLAEMSMDAGADLIIMHHPHVPLGCEIMNSRYVFYSLGNTCFGGNNEVRALETFILQVDFVFSDTGDYTGQQVRIYPAHTTGTYPRSNFQPVLVSGAEAASVMKLVQADTPFQLEPFDETTGCVTQPFLAADGSILYDEVPVPSSTAEE